MTQHLSAVTAIQQFARHGTTATVQAEHALIVHISLLFKAVRLAVLAAHATAIVRQRLLL
jgi:hypothetical protein